eukprot:COSAG02_NODE_715_length_18086_cov_109.753433_16_plen_369_part_00
MYRAAREAAAERPGVEEDVAAETAAQLLVAASPVEEMPRTKTHLLVGRVLLGLVGTMSSVHAQTADASSCDLSTVANRINTACCPGGACAIGASHAECSDACALAMSVLKFGPCESTYTTLVLQVTSLSTQWQTCTARPTEQLRVAVALGCAAAGDGNTQAPVGGGHRRVQGHKSAVERTTEVESDDARRRVQQHTADVQATNERILSDFALDCARQDAPGLPEGRQCMARGQLLSNDDQTTEGACEQIWDNVECSQTQGCTFNYLWFRCEVDCGGTPDSECDATEGCHLEPSCVVDNACMASLDVGLTGACPVGCAFDELTYQCKPEAGPDCESMPDARTCLDTPGCTYNWNGYRCERDVSCGWAGF